LQGRVLHSGNDGAQFKMKRPGVYLIKIGTSVQIVRVER